jgi:hypothetical protein
MKDSFNDTDKKVGIPSVSKSAGKKNNKSVA